MTASPKGLQRLTIGYMPLIDAAIPVVAARKGFDARHGLSLALVRETSWANIRDRLAIGHFEAAHLLAPMPVAAALGMAALDVPLVAPMALGLGGNAITVSGALWQGMVAALPEVVAGDPASVGRALKRLVEAGRKPVFAVVHPFSAHNYEFRYWLAACGMQPGQDVEIDIVPPPLMPDALAAGRIDGFCVGEPWNSVAAARAGGRIVMTKSAIWRGSPEKVLGLRADWAADNPDTVQRLINALLDAALWCEDEGNRPELARLLAGRDALGLEAELLAPALTGRLMLADGRAPEDPDFLMFARLCANFPWRSHALWFFSQMLRWGQTLPGSDLRRVADSYRPDLFRAVALARGLNVPLADAKREDRAVLTLDLPGTEGPVTVSSGGFFDGRIFDPATFAPGLA